MVTSQTAEIGAAEMTLTELRRTVQSLEIDLDSMRNLVRTFSSFHWEQLFLPLHFPLLLPTSLVPGKEQALNKVSKRSESCRVSLSTLSHPTLFPMPLQKASLENSLREVEARYAMQMEQLNGVLLHLESELAQTRAEGQRQTQEYEALLNVKVKLEAEINTYRRLLEDGEDFR